MRRGHVGARCAGAGVDRRVARRARSATSALAMLFVTHNLPLVRSLAQQVAVLADGKIVEFGETERVLTAPEQAYTKRLIADTPSITAAAALT